MVSNFQPFVKDKVVIRRIPREKSATGNVDYFFSVGMALSARAKSRDAAAKFMNFFMNNVEAAKIFQEEFGPPASTAMQNAVKDSLPDSKRRELDFTQAMQKLGTLKADQIFPAGAATVNSEILGKANQDVGFGRADVATSVDEFFEQAAKAIHGGQ
jgi:multiple sugar transport system substrate-binding protein